MARHTRPVVGIEEYDGIVGKSVILQLFEDGSDFLVHSGNAIVEAGHGAPDDRGVGIIGW